MKPKDLKHPFSWKERQPAIENCVLFVPDYYERHEEFVFPTWSDSALFGNDNPVHIEYCSGNGTWIAEKAKKHPEINWVAVEKKFERVRKIWSKIQNLQLSNLFVVCGEAVTFSSYYVKENSVNQIYVNFPDPWPKEKHAKHRLLQPAFTKELGRIIAPNGEALLVTDDKTYCSQMIEEMLKSPLFKPCYPKPHYAEEYPDYGTSFFDSLWRKLGRKIHYIKFKKNAHLGNN